MAGSKPWTFDGQRVAGGNHYTIYHNGIVQPFGATFYGKRGDIKCDVVRVINQLNRLHQGATFSGLDHYYIGNETGIPLCVWLSVDTGLFVTGRHKQWNDMQVTLL